jgi:hypothetical protein
MRYPARLTWRAWLTQTLIYLVALAPVVVVALTAVTVWLGAYRFSPLGLAVIPLFAASEAWAARKAGPSAVAIATAVIPMWLYGMWRNAVYYVAAWRAVFGKTPAWH